MPAINATNLRTLRKRKGWSLDDLAERSRVDRGTISRIETGKQVGNRRLTADRLAQALDVPGDILTGADLPSAAKEIEFIPKSQFSFRIENKARNALSLVASRYGVKATHILHLAPFLFLWAAEESLRKRRDGVDALGAELNAIRRPEGLAHLNGWIDYNLRGEDVLEAEKESIGKRDLFGLAIDYEALRDDYDEYEENPMVQFLRGLSSQLDGLSHFDFWYPATEPNYWICEDEASALVGGDEQAKNGILSGNAPLHELPSAVSNGGPAEVAAWVKRRSDEATSELLGELGLGGENGL